MKPEAQQAREDAFDEQLAVEGEELSLMNGDEEVAVVEAIVTRGTEPTPDRMGRVLFSERGLSSIEIRKADVDAMPKVGWDFIDSVDARHRIKTIRVTDFTYVMACHPNNPQ